MTIAVIVDAVAFFIFTVFNGDTDNAQNPQHLPQHHAADAPWRGTERDPDADLARAPGYAVGHHPVQAEYRDLALADFAFQLSCTFLGVDAEVGLDLLQLPLETRQLFHRPLDLRGKLFPLHKPEGDLTDG